MVIFHSFLYVYQRVIHWNFVCLYSQQKPFFSVFYESSLCGMQSIPSKMPQHHSLDHFFLVISQMLLFICLLKMPKVDGQQSVHVFSRMSWWFQRSFPLFFGFFGDLPDLKNHKTIDFAMEFSHGIVQKRLRSGQVGRVATGPAVVVASRGAELPEP